MAGKPSISMAKIAMRHTKVSIYLRISDIAPEYICNMFSYHDNINHQTRSNRRKLLLDKSNTSFMKKIIVVPRSLRLEYITQLSKQQLPKHTYIQVIVSIAY